MTAADPSTRHGVGFSGYGIPTDAFDDRSQATDHGYATRSSRLKQVDEASEPGEESVSPSAEDVINSDVDEQLDDQEPSSAMSDDERSDKNNKATRESIYLSEERCRILTSVNKESFVCGKWSHKCKKHEQSRLLALDGLKRRYEIGYYIGYTTSKGHTHGRLGSWSTDQSDPFDATLGSNLKEPPGGKPSGPIAQDSPRNLPTNVVHPNQKRNSHVGQSSSPPPSTETSSWYGMLTPDGERTILKGWDAVQSRMDGLGWSLSRVFQTHGHAITWLQTPNQRDYTSSTPTSGRRTPSTRPNPPQGVTPDSPYKNERSQGRHQSNPSDDPSFYSSSDNDSTKTNSDASSHYDSASTASSVTSHLISHRKRSGRTSVLQVTGSKRKSTRRGNGRTNKSAKRKAHKTKNGDRYPSSAPDPSRGDPKKAFGHRIEKSAIDGAMAPTGFSSKDHHLLYDAAVDVSALPGRYISSKSRGLLKELEAEYNADRTAELAIGIVASTQGRQGHVYTGNWQHSRHHGFAKINSEETFQKVAAEIHKSEEPAFHSQASDISGLMSMQGYSENMTEDYLKRGLLPRITREAFVYYQRLINIVREHLAAAGPDQAWDGSRAEVMISHHSQQLLNIRRYSKTKKDLVFRTYTYLREAAKHDFYTQKLNEAVWSQQATASQTLADLQAEVEFLKKSMTGGKKTPAKGDEGTSYRCSHCGRAQIHKALNIEGGRRHCPFNTNGILTKDARDLAKLAAEKMRSNPNKSPKLIVEEVLKDR